MRFADRKRISVAEVLRNYSQNELYLWQAWESRELTDNQRIEHILASGLATYINANSKKGTPRKMANDFIFKSNWLTDQESDSQTVINEFIKGI